MMEMPISSPKDLAATLPGASVLPQLPIAGVGPGKTVNHSSTDNGFLKKLSDAIDKSVNPEPVAPKKLQKSPKTSDQESTTETAPPGLAVGLAGNMPTPEVPPNVDNVTQKANSTAPVAMNLLDVSGAFAQETPKIVPGTGNPPLGIGVQGVANASVPQTPVMEKATVAPSGIPLTAVVPQTPVMEKPTINSHSAVKENTATEFQASEPIPIQRSNVSLMEVNTQAGIVKEPISPQANIPTITAEIGSNPDPNPIDSRIQQDIVAVQVSTQPPSQVATMNQPTKDTMATTASGALGISKTTTPNETIPTAEIEPADMDPANVTGKTEARPEPTATAQTEQEPTEQNFGRSDKDTLALEPTDKTETPTVTISPFEKAFSSVDSPSASDTAVQQSRQDIHEVARQVMDGMTASTDRLKSSQVIITLKPEHLGEVTVKINVDGDRVTAAFHAASSEVRAILESSLPQLRQEMSQNGWKFDSDGVYGGMQQFLADQQQHQRQAEQGQTVIPMVQRLNRDEYEDSIAFTPTGRLQVMSAAAVDYRI